jgi:UDP-glucose 4-epimerase
MILVTGGAGFIGSHLCERLMQNGKKVVVVDNLTSGKKENVPKGCTLIKDDIRSRSFRRHLKNVDTVFHLAADPDIHGSLSRPVASFDVNLSGSLNVLDACRKEGVKNFVFAGSGGAVYGDTAKLTSEKNVLCPISPYGASKAAFDMYLSAYSASYGMNCCSLRLVNVIGPRSERGVIWDFFWKLKKDPSVLEIMGNGMQRKSYIHVSDVVDAFALAAEKLSGFQIYNVSNDGTMTVREVAEVVCKKLSVSPKLKFSGEERGWRGDVKFSPLDCSKLKKMGWKPGFSQKQAVSGYVDYLSKTYR